MLEVMYRSKNGKYGVTRKDLAPGITASPNTVNPWYVYDIWALTVRDGEVMPKLVPSSGGFGYLQPWQENLQLAIEKCETLD